MLKKKGFRGALALLLAVLLCTAMNFAAFIIDTPAMRQNTAQAVALLGQEQSRPETVGGFISSRLDNYSAVLILKTAAYVGDEPYLQKVFGGFRADMPTEEGQTDWDAFCTYADGSKSAPGGLSYSRYWHGYTFLLRLLLCMFNLSNLQMLLLFAQLALLALTLLLMVRRGLEKLIPAFGAAWFFMMPTAMGVCLHYVPNALLTLLACVLILRFDRALSRGIGLPAFFALVGLLINYFDLLSFPVVSLVFPLTLLLALELKGDAALPALVKQAVFCSAAWALGYACMWMLKWGINTLIFGNGILTVIGDQVSLRLSVGGESQSRFSILLRNIRVITDKTAYRVILLAALAVTIGVSVHKGMKPDVRALAVLIPLLIPVMWTLALSNHSYDHTFFTFRTMCSAYFAFFALPPLLFPRREVKP